MDETLTLLAVLAHPDDETFGLGGALAKYSAEGVATHLVCATRGERGWFGPETDNPGLAALGRMRAAELRCAAGHLGLHSVTFLDCIDGDVDQADPAGIIAAIAAQIRRLRPQVVVTFPPDGHYGHPDHIAIAQFTAAAIVRAAGAGWRNPDNLPPHTVAKFYHVVDSRSFVEAVAAAIGPISMEVDGVERNHVGWEEWAVTTRIDARLYFDQVWQAVLCHQSQLPGYGPMVDLPAHTLRRFFGQGTFVRIYSLVNGGREQESDLFEGLR